MGKEAFKEAVSQALDHLAHSHPEFTSDDVWIELLRRGQVEEADSLATTNALGWMFTRASRAGVIEFTGRVERSMRPSRKASAVRVWRSLVLEKEAEGG